MPFIVSYRLIPCVLFVEMIYFSFNIAFRYNKTKCCARLKTTGGQVTWNSGKHLHAPDARDLLKKQIMENFKQDAVRSTASRRSIVQTFCNDALSKGEALSAILPQANSLLSAVNRLRINKNVMNPNPSSLLELKIPEEFKFTSTGESFLLFDSGMLNFKSVQNQIFILIEILF